MVNYNPSIYDGIHTVRVTFQQWNYTGHVSFIIGGNCHGAALLDPEFLECDSQEDIERYTENDCELQYHENDDFFTAKLKNTQGDALEVEEDTEKMKNMIVAIEIVDFREKEQKKARQCANTNEPEK